jgi:YHS domain-containing protein
VRILVLCIAVAVLALGVFGCQQAQETPAEQAETTIEEAVEEVIEEAAPIDPVCGMEVTVESEWTAEYEGVTFYFCSEDCRDKFIATPGEFLKALDEEVTRT